MQTWLKEGTPFTLQFLLVSRVCLHCSHPLVILWNSRLLAVDEMIDFLSREPYGLLWDLPLPYLQCHLLWQSNSKGRYDENVWLQSRWWQDATYDDITIWKGGLVFCLTLTLLQVASIFKFLQFWKIKEILCTCKPFHIDQQLANGLAEMSVSYLHHPLGLRSQNKQPKGDRHTLNLHKSAICRKRNRSRWYIHM